LPVAQVRAASVKTSAYKPTVPGSTPGSATTLKPKGTGLVKEDIEQTMKSIIQRGPDRVMVNPDQAVPSRMAREKFNVEPDIIFIREDGWSLAAPSRLETLAFAAWADRWTHFVRCPDQNPSPISEYSLNLRT